MFADCTQKTAASTTRVLTMKTLLQHVLSLLLMIGAASASHLSLTCSSCSVKHLQQHYCDSPIVVRGRVKDDMTIKVANVYKGGELLSTNRRGRLTIPFVRPSCRAAHLKPGATYLIMGSYHGDTLLIGECDLVQAWSTLSVTQRQGIEDVYRYFCGQCSINGTDHLIRPQIDLGWNGNFMDAPVPPKGGSPSPSSFWRTEDCFYNPLAAKQYLVDDCEALHSVCVPNLDGTGRCAWLLSEKYEVCAARREKSPCVQNFSGAFALLPVWRCKQQCDMIAEKCLREMCLKTTEGVLCS